MPEYIDISVPISPDMLVWSSHERPSVVTSDHAFAGVPARVTALQLTTHTGTHLDAPFHCIPGGAPIDEVPFDTLIGEAEVCDLRGSSEITADRLREIGAGTAPRVLLKTDNSAWIRRGPMPEPPAHLTAEAAQYLVGRGISLLGIDGLTVDGPDTAAAHQALLGAGVIILETIDLSPVAAGKYNLICLPLRIDGVDGAPARAVLRSSSSSAGGERARGCSSLRLQGRFLDL